MSQPFTSKTPQFKAAVDKINKLRANIANSQKVLDRLRTQYNDVIQNQNMQHEIEENNKRIEKLMEEKQQLESQLRPSQSRQPMNQSNQMNQQQQINQPQMSQDAQILSQVLQQCLPSVPTQFFYEGPLNVYPFISQNDMSHLMLMWKTNEGYIGGYIAKFGMFLSCINNSLFSFTTRSKQAINVLEGKDSSGASGVNIDNVFYIFDTYIFFTRNIDMFYESPNAQTIAPLLTSQQQQESNVLVIDKFYIFKI